MDRSSRHEGNFYDAVRLLSAFFVIALHALPSVTPITFSDRLWETILRTAVPYYFLVSGYLTADHMTQEHLSGKIRKVAAVYATHLILTFPFTLALYIRSAVPPVQAITEYILRILLVGDGYAFWHLWFLLSMVYGYTAILLSSRLIPRGRSSGCLLALSFLGLLVGYAANTIYDTGAISLRAVLTEPLMVTGPGRITSGFFYLSAGIALRRADNARRQAGAAAHIAFPAVCTAAAYLCACAFPIWPIAVLFHLALFVTICRTAERCTAALPAWVRSGSYLLYYVHMFWCLPFIFSPALLQDRGILRILLVSCASAATAVVLIRAKGRPAAYARRVILNGFPFLAKAAVGPEKKQKKYSGK